MERLKRARDQHSDDDWFEEVESWNISLKKKSLKLLTKKYERFFRSSLEQVTTNNIGMNSHNYYLHPWKKGYQLLPSKTKSITTYPVELITISNLEMMKSLKDRKIRQFCLYDGTFYSGEIRKNKVSTQETYIFRFHEDGDCEIKISHLDNIRIQIIRYGRRPQK